MNPKQKNILLFKSGMFAELLLQTLDDLNVNSEVAIEIKEKSNEFIKVLEPMVEEIYKNSIYSKYAIMQEATKKTDTIAKKIYDDCLNAINEK
jgi:hypothetical protein